MHPGDPEACAVTLVVKFEGPPYEYQRLVARAEATATPTTIKTSLLSNFTAFQALSSEIIQ